VIPIYEPDGGRAPAASLPRHPPHVPRDQPATVPVPTHGQERGDLDLPQAQRCLTRHDEPPTAAVPTPAQERGALDLRQPQRPLTDHGDRAPPPGRAPGDPHPPAT